VASNFKRGGPKEEWQAIHPAAWNESSDVARKSPVSVATMKAAFALRLQGFGNAEIGRKLNLHPVTVSRIFTKMKKLEVEGVVPEEPKNHQPMPRCFVTGETG